MRITRTAVLALVFATSTPLLAEEFANKIPDRIWVDIGGSTNELSTNVTVSGQSGIGAAIDFEDVFDLPGSKSTFQILGTVRVSEHRRWVDFGYVNFRRSGGRQIEQDVQWGDYFFATGAVVDASFDTAFTYAAYRYDFLHEEKIRLSGSAGLSWTDLSTTLAGTATFDDGSGPQTGSYSVEESIAAPVPLIGFNMDWAITKGLVLRTYNRFFRIKLSDIDGGMYENGIHLNWYFIKNFGLGLGYDRVSLKINEYTTSEGDTGKFNYTVTGLGLYATLAF